LRKETEKERAVRRRKEWNLWFNSIKQQLSCIICGEDRTVCLDFHHLNTNEKENDISSLQRNMNKQKVIEEIKKCVPVCACCHRLIHVDEIKVTKGHKKMFDLAFETVLNKVSCS
jgi:hypothetical protein